jgi:hypothetical protein
VRALWVIVRERLRRKPPHTNPLTTNA